MPPPLAVEKAVTSISSLVAGAGLGFGLAGTGDAHHHQITKLSHSINW
jgi:hypothetical protein